MAVLVQGEVRDRPWGQTLGALGLRGLTGQLTLRAEDRDYAIAFDLGGVIGAWSANAADSAPRVALTNHLLSSSQVAAIARRIAAQPERDEVEVVAEMARLTPEQVETLREKLVAQRAARTFSVDVGEFTVEDEVTIPVIPGPGLDIRTVVYLGARMNLSEQRLTNGIRHFGAYFQLKADAIEVLDRFGFTDAERTVLVELRAGTSLYELEAAHRDIDPRMVQAVVYALFACGACDVSEAPAMPRAATLPAVQPPKRAPSAPLRAPSAPPAEAPPYPQPEPAPYGPFVSRTATQDPYPTRTPTPGLADPRAPRIPTENPFPVRSPTPPKAGRPGTENPFPMRTPTPPISGQVEQDDWRRPISGPDRAGTENPFPMRTPTPPISGQVEQDDWRRPISGPDRAGTENPFPLRTPTPPAIGRTSTENPFPVRMPTPPVQSRTPTDNPFPARMPTPPVQSRTVSGGARPVNGPDEAGVPRNRGGGTTPTRTTTPLAIDPLNPPTNRTPRPGGAPPSSRTTSEQPLRTPTADPVVARAPSDGAPRQPRTPTGAPAIARTSTARKTAALVAARLIVLEQGADYFALLGVPWDAPIELVRSTYLNLVRQLHPDKLAELDVDDPAGNATRLFAAMGNAFSVLTDPVRREEYVASISGGEPTAPRTTTADELARAPAMEAFRKGEAALRRDEPHEAIAHFQRAVELAPQDVDMHAMHAWAQFCASTEKEKTAVETRRYLERAINKSPKPVAARFLLGRVERMLGRDREALRHFQIVLEIQASHAEARSEVRAIEARLSGNAKKR
ncbi:MAG: DnaJ domain-containing protein [Myxococcales bacterium]|nr:DnaJ domain-containing protein [Myxococcales bacterium]